MSRLNCFKKIPRGAKRILKNSCFEQNHRSRTVRIQSNVMNTIYSENYFSDFNFIKILKYFDEVMIEFDTQIQFYESAFKCISFWSSKKIKINLIVSDINSIINFLRNETSMYEITLNSSLTSIPLSSLSDCHSLKKIIIPSSVTEIGAYAFSECSSLKSITMPSSVTNIGVGAFRMCSLLDKISIPSLITKISDSLFFKCSSLKKIEIPSSVTVIERYSFSGCSSLKKIVIHSSVSVIKNNAFENCSSLEEFSIPSSITEIENSVFKGCSSLEKVIIPSSVTIIKSSAFSGCSSLVDVSIPSSVTVIESNAFENCSSLVTIKIPFSVTKIENYTFSRCTSLQKVSIPTSLNEIKQNAFSKCSSLTQISIPSSVKVIEQNAFSSCLSLQAIEIPSCVNKIENNTFNGCISLKKVIIPSSVTEIGWGCFNGCLSLKKIDIPSSVTSIGHYAFNECSSLIKIEIPSSIIKIENNTFSKCKSLKKVLIPSSVTEIGHFAFNECSSLKEIEIPSSVKSIGNNAFSGCTLMKNTDIQSHKNSENKHHYSIDDFDLLHTLGRGSYGKVQLVSCKLDGKLYALKSIKKKVIEESNIYDAIINERDALFKFHHPFLVSARFCFQDEQNIFIVLDYIGGGVLSIYLLKNKQLSINEARFYAAEIALGIGHIHKLGYVYRDLKPDNILIDTNGHLKISDFGFIRKVDEISGRTSTFCGTIEYISPEMFLEKPNYTKDVDWWSYGILVYQMIFGCLPFYAPSQNKTIESIIHDDLVFPCYDKEMPQSTIQFITDLLQKDPTKRLGFGEDDVEAIKNHPFFDDINWDDLLILNVKANYIPEINNDIDVSNFNEKYTQYAPQITLVEYDSANTNHFQGFSLVNPE